MRDKYLVFGQPTIGDAEIAEVVHSLRANWLGTGPKVAAFEATMAEYKGVRHAVALNSCTAGLHLSCIAAGLQPGDEVIVPAMTFCATVNAVIHGGLTPVPADVDPHTFNIDPAEARRKISPRTKAIMPVHFAGRAADMDALNALAREFGLKVIEDCAHALETEYRGRKAGAMGDFGVLSFYSTKNVATGEGGMILTDDDDVAARVKRLALHGMSSDAWHRFSDNGYRHYEVVEIGYKYNMMDLQAAIGIHQFARVQAGAARRVAIWDTYNRAFADLPVQRPAPLCPGDTHGLHLYTLLIDPPVERDEFMMALHGRGIGTGVHYRAIPAHRVYRERFGWSLDDYPNAKRIGETTVSLPLSPALSSEDVQDVICAVREVLDP